MPAVSILSGVDLVFISASLVAPKTCIPSIEPSNSGCGLAGFFHELACIKNSVVGLKPQMPIRLPAQFRARTVPTKRALLFPQE